MPLGSILPHFGVILVTLGSILVIWEGPGAPEGHGAEFSLILACILVSLGGCWRL